MLQDKRYNAIMVRLQHTRKEWKGGSMDQLLKLDGVDRQKELQKTSLSLDGRGRKAIDSTTRTENELTDWLDER